MKLLIFGATGSVGREVVVQALAQGHEVTVFAREPARLASAGAGTTVARGDVLNVAEVERAVRGQDAVVCALGAGRKGMVRSEGTASIVRSMEAEGVRRLVCLSTLGAGDSRGNLNWFWRYLMFGLLLREAFADHERQEDVVRRSRLDWTLVRPGAFTEGERTGEYRHGFPATERGLRLKVSRADVADFLLRQVTDDTYLRRAPGLSY